MIRKSDWRINCTQIANQTKGKNALKRLKEKIPTTSYNCVRKGSMNYLGTYVDFDVGINWCRELGFSDLADQLLHLRHTENERAIEIQQDSIVSPVLEGAVTAPFSSRLANSNHDQNTAVAGSSYSQESPKPKNLMVTNDTESESSEEDDDSLEKDDASSVDTDITQLHAPRSNESDDEVSSRHSNDDIETNSDQCVEGRTSYYSYGDFELRNSELKEVKVDLQAPSKTSSRYDSMTDVSRSSLWTAFDE